MANSQAWLYLASDYYACIRDARGLPLRHGFLWYPGAKQLSAGDRVLLVFRYGTEFVPLLRLEVEGASARGLSPIGGRYGDRLVEIPDNNWGDFKQAIPGNGGIGYAGQRRALSVRTLDSFAADWANVGPNPHDAPGELRFGIAPAGGYLRHFEPAELQPRLLPRGYWP